MNKFPLIFNLLILILLTSSCNNATYYNTLTYNVPMESSMLGISEKGEIKVSGAGNSSYHYYNQTYNTQSLFFSEHNQYSNHFSLSGGYGFHKHFAVQSNSFLFLQDVHQVKKKMFQQSIAVGAFYKHEKIKEKRKRTLNKEFIADAYLGMGIGGIHHNFEGLPGYGKLRLNYFRGYLHTGFSYHRGRLFRFGLSSKFIYTDYMVLNQINDIPSYDNVQLNRIKEVDPFIHIELSPKVSIGRKYAFVYVSMNSVVGQSIFYYNEFNDYRYESPPGYLNSILLGMELNISEIMNKRKENKMKKDLGVL